jgi:hypothetical protein
VSPKLDGSSPKVNGDILGGTELMDIWIKKGKKETGIRKV